MSVFSSIISGLSKAENFLVSVLTKTTAVATVLASISPKTLSAILALFYDVMKAVTAGSAAFADLTSGNIAGAGTIILSPTTIALLTAIEGDIKNVDAVVIADLKALGIAIETPSVPVAAPAVKTVVLGS